MDAEAIVAEILGSDQYEMLLNPMRAREYRDQMLNNEVWPYNGALARRWITQNRRNPYIDTTNRLRSSSGNDIETEQLQQNIVETIVDGTNHRTLAVWWTTMAILIKYLHIEYDDLVSIRRNVDRYMYDGMRRVAWSLLELLDYLYTDNPTALSSHGVISSTSEYTLDIKNEARRYIQSRYDTQGRDRQTMKAMMFAIRIVSNVTAAGLLRLNNAYDLRKSHYRYDLLARRMRARSYQLTAAIAEHVNVLGRSPPIEDVGIPENLLPDEGPAPYTRQDMRMAAQQYMVGNGIPVNALSEIQLQGDRTFVDVDVRDDDLERVQMTDFYRDIVRDRMLDIFVVDIANLDRRIPEVVTEFATQQYGDRLRSLAQTVVRLMVEGHVMNVIDTISRIPDERLVCIRAILEALFTRSIDRRRNDISVAMAQTVVLLCWTRSKLHTLLEIVRAMTHREFSRLSYVFTGTPAIAQHPLFVHTVYATAGTWVELDVDVPPESYGLALGMVARNAWCLAPYAMRYAAVFPAPPIVPDELPHGYTMLYRMVWAIVAAGARFRDEADTAVLDAFVEETHAAFDYETMKVVMQQGRLEAVEWIMSTRIGASMKMYFPKIVQYAMVTFPGTDLRSLIESTNAGILRVRQQ